jgi:nitrogen-specific signal transduction histidine kinase
VFFNLQTSLPYINGKPRHERPIWIWDRDTASFVWANGEGVKFWSAPSLESLQATSFDKSHPAWLKVCQILDGMSPSNIHSEQAIGVDLYFPHMNGGAQLNGEAKVFHSPSLNKATGNSASGRLSPPLEKKVSSKSNEGHFVALCRRGNLKNRTALIVEVIAVTENKAQDQTSSLADTPSLSSPLSTDLSFLPENSSSLNGTLPDHLEISSQTEDEQQLVENLNSDLPFEVSSEIIKELVPRAQLEELARLIKEAGGDENDVLKARSVELAPDLVAKTNQETNEPLLKENSHILSGVSRNAKQEKWSPLEIDLTSLSGVGDQEELEEIFETESAPYALISLQKIIHANGSFVSEFGYDDIDPLINDGADWLFPKSRDVFSALISSEIGTSTTGSSHGLDLVRLRSGRKLSRDVLITPVRLTKFDRTLLLIQLANEFNYTEKENAVDLPTEARTDLGQTFDTKSETTSIPLLSAVSHEVRTPLNVILGFSEVMSLEQFGPLGHEKYKDYVQDIHNSAQHALSLINDLLDLTKLKAGKWLVEPAEVEINTLVRDQVRLMRELAAQKNVRLRSDLEENLPLVHVDERSLQQILLNLISNGIKYDKEGGLITVQTMRQDENTLILSVSDTGPGMSEDEIRHAMEPFHQVINDPASYAAVNPAYIGSKKSKSGTGLGLPISKALAEANGIDFSIDSQRDRGTKVSLTFQISTS